MQPRIVGFWTKLSSLGDQDGIETPGSPPTEAEIDPGPVPALAPVLPAEDMTGELLLKANVDTRTAGARTIGRGERIEILENLSLRRRQSLPKMTRIIIPWILWTSSDFIKVTKPSWFCHLIMPYNAL